MQDCIPWSQICFSPFIVSLPGADTLCLKKKTNWKHLDMHLHISRPSAGLIVLLIHVATSNMIKGVNLTIVDKTLNWYETLSLKYGEC